MPLKVPLLIIFLSMVGGTLGTWIVFQCLHAWKNRRYFILSISLGLLMSSLALAYGVLFTFVPCFQLFDPPFCRGSQNQKWVALSFDDGPQEPTTSQILDILHRQQIPATFFVVGRAVKKYPQILQRIASEGHTIGNHTYSHRPRIFFSEETIQAEMDQWEQVVQPLISIHDKIFRAPHGWKSFTLKNILSQRGYRLVGWTYGVWDSDQPGTEILLERLKKKLAPGAVILLHDGEGNEGKADRSQTADVLEPFIQYARNQGFRFVTIPEMMGPP